MTCGVMLSGLTLVAQTPLPADTSEARRAAAEEFLTVVPVAEEVGRLIREISEHLPLEKRRAFVEQMNHQVDMTYMKAVMLDGLVADLSVAELRAATAFYSSQEGHAIREKLPNVIDHVMPLIQKELAETARRLP
jgi:hypothetical protein